MPQVEAWEEAIRAVYRELGVLAPSCACNNSFTPGTGEEKMAVESLAVIPGSVFLEFKCRSCGRVVTRLIMREKDSSDVVLQADHLDVTTIGGGAV